MAENISGLIIARNEERDLPQCLEAWRTLCSRIVLVDDGSTDATSEIAHNYGCDVVPSGMDPATGFSGLRNTGLEKIDTPLTLVFDADERPTDCLVNSIEFIRDTESAYKIHRRNHAFGRPLNYGRFSEDYQVRIFPSHVRYAGKVHETPTLPESMPVQTLEGSMEHFTYRSIAEYFSKMREYARIVAEEHQMVPSVASIIKERASEMLKRRGYRDGWRAGVMALGDTLHDLMVMEHLDRASLTGDAYIGSAQQRAFDIVTATTMLAAGSPVCTATALALGVSHRSRDVLFKQQRIGKNGNPISIHKLRTIPGHDRSGSAPATGPHHPEASPLGNTVRLAGMDEFPQLIEVLAGTMNMRGIRPQTEVTLEQRQRSDPKLFDDWYNWAIRNPGIFGPGQAYAHKARTYSEDSPLMREVMRMDITACETASITNDARDVLGIPIKMARLIFK